jgi:two-component system NarL family sensor kinase
MHPPLWSGLTLEEALRQTWDLSGIPQRFEAQIDLASLPEQPDPDTRSVLFRGAQEAISNLTQHSKATRASMTLAVEDGTLVLRVEDNGVGFDTARQSSAPASVGSGLGLRSLREQAESVGGEVSIASGGAGTRVEIRAPYVREGGA